MLHPKAQTLDKIARLPDALNEISGLIAYNDSLFVCHNDGGDLPQLYLINKKGKIVHQVLVNNATNVDWEDITQDDKGNLYIGDIGNNLNQRRDLCIYKIKRDSLLYKAQVNAERIPFVYINQNAFPPVKAELNFDAEALGWYRDSLFIFTKCRTEPFTGISKCYSLLPRPGKTQTAQYLFSVQLPSRSMRKDAVTSMCFVDKRCFLLSYDRLTEVDWLTRKLNPAKEINFVLWTQKEALCRMGNTFFLADERVKLLGGKLYQIKY